MPTCPRCHAYYPGAATTCDADGEALVADEAVEPELEAGTRVGEYQVEGKLGEGAFGTVYRAVHPLIGKPAAIKVLNRQFSASPEMVSRFVAEARAVNQIGHRNIIDIFSFGQLPDGRHYYVMELLRGSPLDAYLAERGRLSLEEAAPIIRGIARALGAAHAAGIAHRDLKPENVFITEDDGVPFPKLIDFGIAKLLGETPASSHKTRTGAPIGTPYFMSPEQCRGRNVDHRTDVYALGILIHLLLTGKRPFDGEDVMDVLMAQITAAPPRMSEVCPDLPASLDEPVLRMVEKDVDRRPSSVTQALAAFEAAAGAAGNAARSSVLPARPSGRPSVPSSEKIAIRPAGDAGEDAQSLAEAHTLVPTPQPPSAGPSSEAPAPLVAPLNTLEPAARSAPALPAAPPKVRTWALIGGIAALAAVAAVALSRPPTSREGPPSTVGAVVTASPLPASSASSGSLPVPEPSVVPAAESSAPSASASARPDAPRVTGAKGVPPGAPPAVTKPAKPTPEPPAKRPPGAKTGGDPSDIAF